MLLLSAVCLLLISATSTDANCVDKLIADIYILTDGSNSINGVGWGRSLAFVSNFIKSFPVGPSQVQFAYGTFSTRFVHIFDLNTYYDKEELSKEVLNTPQLKGVTYTFDALKAIRLNRYLNSRDKGARPDVPKILLIITDGNSDNITSTIAEADALRREQDVRIVAVSVGSVNQVECIGLADTETNVFTVRNFGALEAIRNQIAQTVCVEQKKRAAPINETLDLVFVVDSSESVTPESFNKNFEFIAKTIRQFKVGPLATRVAVVTSSTCAQDVFPLTHDFNIIYEKLSSVPYPEDETDTADAIYRASQLLSLENGARRKSTKVAVIVSDGHVSDTEKTLKAASVLRDQQVKVITLLVGTVVDEKALRQIASKPEYTIRVPNYNVLVSHASNVSDIVSHVRPKVSPEKPAVPPPIVELCPTATIVDIFFLVDSSGSIGQANYVRNFEFIRKIIDAYYIAEDGAKVAMLTFGSSVKPKFKLSADKQFILEQFQNVHYQGSETKTHLALAYILNEGWNKPENGARKGSQVIILITDGRFDDPQKTLTEAKRLKKAGISIIVVGVTKNVNKNELRAVASKPEYVITADSYSVLDYIASKTSDIACSEAKTLDR